jgi:soluble lytic murein transglycosylase
MHRKKQIILVILLGLMLLVPAFFAEAYEYKISQKDKLIFKSAFTKTRRGQYDAAINEASHADNPVLVKIIKWLGYQDGYAEGGAMEIANFIDKNPTWPSMKLLKNKLEFSITGKEPAADIIKYFVAYPPATGHGMRILAEAKIETGSGMKEAIEMLKQSWQQGDFSRDELESFLRYHGKILTQEDHYKRVDKLLWDENIAEAKHLYPLLGEEQKKIVQVRLHMMGKHPSAIARVSEALKRDPGILYEDIKLQSGRENFALVYQMLYPVITTMPNQPKWWKIKNRLIRELLDRNEIDKAYYIAKNHGNEVGSSEYPDAEWLAGWIALRYLGKPEEAYKHFYNMYNNVKFPVSLSRAAYWAGRAAQSNHNKDISQNWFIVSAAYPTTFYGQLSNLKINGSDSVLALPKDPQMGILQENSTTVRELLNAAYILEYSGQTVFAEKFIKAAINSVDTPGEMAYIGEFGIRIGRTNFAVVAGKEALTKGVALVNHGWPETKYMPQEISVEKPFVLSIIRQESVFNPNAISSAKAMGLMQLIPETAKRMAKIMRVSYSPSSLIANPGYNIKLGSYYLKHLIDEWDGSYILAIASYNAGPGNVHKWIKKYRDPREMRNIEDIVDWVESIPFNETRNYVQRVLENIQVYRSKTPDNQLSLADDLTRGMRKGL